MKEKSKKRVLLSFVAGRDPYPWNKGAGEYDTSKPGPILTLINSGIDNRRFELVYLLYTETRHTNTQPNTQADKNEDMKIRAVDTKEAINNKFSGVEVILHPMKIDDPVSYEELLIGLREFKNNVSANKGDIFISVSSGTPTMHACWLLLAASREIPANVLYVREDRYVTDKFPLINEVRFDSPSFPKILPYITTIEKSTIPGSDVYKAIRKLEIVGDDENLQSELKKAARFAMTDSPVLVTGESGSGKDLFAQFIHEISSRNDKPFLPINCASIPESLFESEFFGYKAGAFTDAKRDKKGYFDIAYEGTLFLDEIGDLAPVLQAKLLRVIEGKEVLPVGAEGTITPDVRIIAATNKDLFQAVKEKRFREDLFYRLNTLQLRVPPLRERRSDILKISGHFIEKFNRKNNMHKKLSDAAEKVLLEYKWPGNVRALKSTLDRAMVLSESDEIEDIDIDLQDLESVNAIGILPELPLNVSLEEHIQEYRNQMYLKAYNQANKNMSEAARILGTSPQGVSQYLKRRLNIS